jgi:hypothetical protein
VQNHRYLRRPQKREVFTTPLSPVKEEDDESEHSDADRYGGGSEDLSIALQLLQHNKET